MCGQRSGLPNCTSISNMELFKIGFITVRLVDIIDISIVTILFYRLYELLRGSIAVRILVAIVSVFITWKLVDLLDLVLLKSILDQFLGVGAIALIILFAPEIRRFLIMLGKNTIFDRALRQLSLTQQEKRYYIESLIEGVEDLKKGKLGALIVLTGSDNLERIQETGEILGSEVSEHLLYSIFLPASPLHDGAVLIDNNRVAAARCILPLTDNKDLPPELGLRHRSALGVSEQTDALVIIVSEERQEISVAYEGELERNLDRFNLEKRIRKFYGQET